MPRFDYDALCAGHDVGAPDATLSYLHQAGEVFSLPGVFQGDVVLDQAWALEGLYALLHRRQVLPVLRQNRGHFTRELLAALIWDAQGFGVEEQANFLSMLQRCGVCFDLGGGQYLAPDCLPGLDAVQKRLDMVWHGRAPALQLTLSYPYLHDGLRRTLVSTVGRAAGLEAVYWRYGAAFYDAIATTAVRMDCCVGTDPRHPLAGSVTLAAADVRGRDLLQRLADALVHAASLAEPPLQHWHDASGHHHANIVVPLGRSRPGDGTGRLDADEPPIHATQSPVAPGALPAVHVSYASGGDSDVWVDALERALEDCCTWRRDKRAMQAGDWLSDFMDEIADARCVVAVISDKSLRSPYCMRELLGLYRTSNGSKSRLLERLVPVLMPDAAIDGAEQRAARVNHWRGVHAANAREQRLIDEFVINAEEVLEWVADVLMPRPGMPGADTSVQAVASIVRQRLAR